MRIDVHDHAIPPEALELLRREPVYGDRIDASTMHVTGDHPPFALHDAFVDPAAKLAQLERLGIDAAVVSLAPTVFHYEVETAAGEALALAVNEGLARFAAHDDRRLRWMAHVPLQAPERAVAVLEQAAAQGAVAVEVGTSVAGRRLDAPELDVFWEGVQRLRRTVMLHPAALEPHRGLTSFYLQNVIGFPLETTIAVERLICAGVLDRHPEVELLLVHGGGFFPYQAGRLRHAASVRPELAGTRDPWSYVGRLWFDTITHDAAALRHLLVRVGADRVVLGTDLPFDMAPREPVRELEAALAPALVRRVAEENPARLVGVRAR